MTIKTCSLLIIKLYYNKRATVCSYLIYPTFYNILKHIIYRINEEKYQRQCSISECVFHFMTATSLRKKKKKTYMISTVYFYYKAAGKALD